MPLISLTCYLWMEQQRKSQSHLQTMIMPGMGSNVSSCVVFFSYYGSMMFMDCNATFFCCYSWDIQKFSAAQPVPSSEQKDSAKLAESKPQSTSGIEDLFKDSPAVSVSSAPAVSQANAKNDIMSLFEKVSTALLLQHLSRRIGLPTKERAHPWCI